MLRIGFTALLLAIGLGSMSCSQNGAPQSATNADTLAKVTKLNLVKVETFPVQVTATIEGELPDTCTHFTNISQNKKNNTFLIRLVTQHAPGKCESTSAPFSVDIPIEANGLKKGTYEVDVNGVKESFTLDQDNAIGEE